MGHALDECATCCSELQRSIESQDVLSPLLSPTPLTDMSAQYNVRQRRASGDRGVSPSSSIARGMVSPAQLMQLHPAAYMQWMQTAMTSSSPSPQPTPPPPPEAAASVKRPPATRVKVRGGLPTQRLSRMSTDAVCELLQRLHGISQQNVATYRQRLVDNNITGQVALSVTGPAVFEPQITAFRHNEILSFVCMVCC